MKRKMILLVTLLLLGFSYSNAQYGPVVSLSFDDGGPSWYDLAFPVFQEYVMPGVCFINATNWWVAQGQSNIDKLLEMQAAGWEIGSHGYNHSEGTTENNVSLMKDWLDNHGFLPNSGFQQAGCGGCPSWSHDAVNIVKQYHPYYTLGPGSPYGMSEPYDIYGMRRTPMENGKTDAEIIAALDSAVANNEWVIFYGHSVGNSPSFETSVDRLRLIFDECISRGIPIKTIREVITDVYPLGRVIGCSEDTLQDPVLTYFEEGGAGSFSTSVWNEYWHNTSWTGPRYIGSPVVYCHTSNDSLPVMKFFLNVPDGEYEVRATIIPYDIGRTYRLYYSFDEGNPSQDSVEVNKNSDVSLGQVTVTNGQFALYTQKADVVSGGDGYVGWAYIRLIAQVCTHAKVFLQGSYAGGSMTTSLNSSGMIPFHHPYNDTLGIWNYTGSERIYNLPPDIVDWVLVELRTGTAENTTVGRRAALLKSDGTIVDLDGSSQLKFKGIVPGSYYIIIRHRNHLPIMSANPVMLSNTNTVLYDFTDNLNKAYSSGSDPMKLINGKYAMFSGDADGNGSVLAPDYSLWLNENGTGVGYLEEDFDMNGQVLAPDYNLNWVPNNGNQTQVP